MKQKPFLKFSVFGLPRTGKKGAGGTPVRERSDRSVVNTLAGGHKANMGNSLVRIVGFISSFSGQAM